MNKAEILLGYMDQVKAFIELIHTYIEKGLELLQQAKVWISTVIDWIERGVDYLVSKFDLNELDRAIVDSEKHGFIKVLTKPKSDKILGVTIVGDHAGDYIGEYVTAMKYNLGLNKILGTIHIYPTFAESNKFVAGVWKKKTTPIVLLKIVEKWHAFRR